MQVSRRLAKEDPNWSWTYLPRPVKLFTWLVGAPSFVVLVWEGFTDSLSKVVVGIAFGLFFIVALTQAYSLNKVIKEHVN